jgi:hypothetical protein
MEYFFTLLGNTGRDLDPLVVEIMTPELRETIELIFQDLREPFITVTEARCGRGHLEIQVRGPSRVIEKTSLTALKYLGQLSGVNRISPRAILGIQLT